MFTLNDYDRARRGFFMHLGICVAILLVMVVFFVIALTLRLRFVALGVLVLGSWAAYFYAMMVMVPWLQYFRLMRDMHGGLSRVYEARFVRVSPDARMLDGVEVNDFVVCEEDDEESELLYLWDADKPVPDCYKKGQKLRIESFGKYIKNIEIL